MPTYIELHLVTFFTLFMLITFSVKSFLKCHAKCWTIIVSSTVFAIIKLLMDYYNANILSQICVVIFYCLTASLGMFKFNHISKLTTSMLVFAVYYICLIGLQAILSKFLNTNMFYLSNYYLVAMLGLNLMLFSFSQVVLEYLKLKNNIKLTKICTLKVANKKIIFSGFVDTGNRLKDPISGKSVVIVNMDILKKQLSSQMYADILFATNASGNFEDIHKIKYATISGTNFITVFRPQVFLAENKAVECYIGVSSTSIACDALLNASCL